MSNRTINRILISTICALCIAICVLITLIISRPQQVTTQGSTSAAVDEISGTEIFPFDNISTENPPAIEEETSTSPTSEESHTIYAKTTSLLNIRETNSTDAAVLETVSENTILQVLEIQPDGWTKILYEGQEGYVSSAYIILVE